jgi:hypothetical protein
MEMVTTPQNSTPDPIKNDSESMKKRKKIKVAHVGNFDFDRIEPSDLGTVPVMVQALDNQWMPGSILRSVMQKGYLTDHMEQKRRKLVRAEYIRALINGQQVVLNRAYLINSRAVSQDYFQKGEKREAFKALLEKGVIVPYLLTENAPVDPPSSGQGTDSSWEPDPRVARWREVCQEVHMRCVRLSWDDKENWETARQ